MLYDRNYSSPHLFIGHWTTYVVGNGLSQMERVRKDTMTAGDASPLLLPHITRRKMWDVSTIILGVLWLLNGG